MISINCDVDEIQTAIDKYREIESIVDQAIESVVASSYEVLSELGLGWVSPISYLKFLAFLNHNKSVDELVQELTGIKPNFHFYGSGGHICDDLERYMVTTSEATTHFLLSGDHLDFVCFFCSVDAQANYAPV